MNHVSKSHHTPHTQQLPLAASLKSIPPDAGPASSGGCDCDERSIPEPSRHPAGRSPRGRQRPRLYKYRDTDIDQTSQEPELGPMTADLSELPRADTMGFGSFSPAYDGIDVSDYLAFDNDDPCLVAMNCEREMKRMKMEAGHRIGFRTKSEVEILDDGFKWRKYGKKSVKNSPNPRNYYRCSSEGCGVKKRVERDREDPRYVITTYEGVHNHPSPSTACCGFGVDHRHCQASSSGLVSVGRMQVPVMPPNPWGTVQSAGSSC